VNLLVAKVMAGRKGTTGKEHYDKEGSQHNEADKYRNKKLSWYKERFCVLPSGVQNHLSHWGWRQWIIDAAHSN